MSIPYYNRIASTYDATLAADNPRDTLRGAFWAFVEARAPRTGTVLDFGAGTGLDVGWLLERGHRVIAYDPSTGMLDVLRQRCAEPISQGRVAAVSSLDLVGEPVAFVIANFAVFNHFWDLAPVFRWCSDALAPGGWIFASIQNPWHWKAICRWWWWRGLPSLVRHGILSVHGKEQTLYRHTKRAFQSIGRPSFELVEFYGPRNRFILADGFRFVAWKKL